LEKKFLVKARYLNPTLLKFEKLMQTFNNLMDLYEVVGQKVVATSDMRKAKRKADYRSNK